MIVCRYAPLSLVGAVFLVPGCLASLRRVSRQDPHGNVDLEPTRNLFAQFPNLPSFPTSQLPFGRLCFSNKSCKSGRCSGTCVDCTSSKHCDDGDICRKGLCVGCGDNADCINGYCAAGKCISFTPSGGSCSATGIDFTCATGYCNTNSVCGTYDDNGDRCPFLDSYDDTAEDVKNALRLEDSSEALFRLPSDSVASNIVDFLIDEITSTVEEQYSGGSDVLLPMVVRAKEDSISDAGDGIDACENLDVVQIDSFAFGYQSPSGIGLCAAFNPCKHLYALSQTGILPAFTIAKIITFEADSIGFSLERGGLVHTSVNKMWSGGEVDYLEVPGHVYIAGTGSVGIKISERISATLKLMAELIIDADLNENGFFQPLGESTSYDEDEAVEAVASDKIPNVDFALLASGTQSAEITLQAKTQDYTVDLGGFIQSKKDLYIEVDDTDVEVQYASGVDISLKGLCDLSEALAPICKIFGDSGISGRVNAYFNTGGDFGFMLALSGKFELDISGGNEEIEEIMEDLFGGADVSFEGSAEASLDFDDGILEICLNLNKGKFDECLGFCKGDSDCADDKFCNPILGLCRPRRKNGFFPCVKDSQCYSDRCVDTTRVCAAKKNNGDVCIASKECKSGHCNGMCGEPCAGNSDCSSKEFCNHATKLCRPERDNNYYPCISDDQCNSGRCVDTSRVCAAKKENGDLCSASKECKSGHCNGMCGEPCSGNSNCSSNEFCNPATKLCRPKRDNNYSPCISDDQCKSGRCVDTSRVCASKKSNGSTCWSNKECSSGRCKYKFPKYQCS